MLQLLLGARVPVQVEPATLNAALVGVPGVTVNPTVPEFLTLTVDVFVVLLVTVPNPTGEGASVNFGATPVPGAGAGVGVGVGVGVGLAVVPAPLRATLWKPTMFVLSATFRLAVFAAPSAV